MSCLASFFASAAEGGAMRLKGVATFSANAVTGESSMESDGADAATLPPSPMRLRRSVAAEDGRNIIQYAASAPSVMQTKVQMVMTRIIFS